MSKVYEAKFEELKFHHKEEVKSFEEKLRKLEENHTEEMENVKQNHLRVLSEVKNEYFDQIERFKENKIKEQELYAKSDDFLRTLNSSADKLDRSENILETLQEKVVRDYSVLSMAREKTLEAKEKEVICKYTKQIFVSLYVFYIGVFLLK